MSITISNVTNAPTVQPAQSVSKTGRAADGDYLTAGVGRSSTKDADGDYRPSVQATGSSQAASSSATAFALAALKSGG